MKQPQLWVFAAPNGAGKSTIVDRYVLGRLPVVNPDTIARGLDPALVLPTRAMRAGRLALVERAGLLAEQRSFAIETTLTGHAELHLMSTARQAGFKVSLVFVGLRSVQHSIGRVAERVARGGHDVPTVDLLRRFDRSLGNLESAILLADRTILLDNSGRRAQLIHSREGGRVKFTAPSLPNWAVSAIEFADASRQA